MSRTLQDQLAQVITPDAHAPTPRIKSELRRMADRAGHPAGVKHAPETVINGFLGRLNEWYLGNLQQSRGK